MFSILPEFLLSIELCWLFIIVVASYQFDLGIFLTLPCRSHSRNGGNLRNFNRGFLNDRIPNYIHSLDLIIPMMSWYLTFRALIQSAKIHFDFKRLHLDDYELLYEWRKINAKNTNCSTNTVFAHNYQQLIDIAILSKSAVELINANIFCCHRLPTTTATTKSAH